MLEEQSSLPVSQEDVPDHVGLSENKYNELNALGVSMSLKSPLGNRGKGWCFAYSFDEFGDIFPHQRTMMSCSTCH